MQGVSTASPPPSPEPGPPAKPSRSSLTMRDMLGAVGLLAVAVLLIGGLTRGCSFAPGGPTSDPSAGPTVDAPGALRSLAGSTPFALRVPAVPADWRANAVGTARVGTGDRLAVSTGYVTPAGRYLRLVQSDAAEADLLASEAQGRPVGSGVVDVDGTRWVTYADDTREPIRIADVDGVRLLITGDGDDAEFRALATAAAGAAPLPR
jgi:hypothetical protein